MNSGSYPDLITFIPKVSEDARDPLEKVLSSVRSWYTIDTMRFVRGDDHVREALRESGVSAANVVAVIGDDTFGSGVLRSKYVELCRKLDMRDSLGEKTGIVFTCKDFASNQDKFQRKMKTLRI